MAADPIASYLNEFWAVPDSISVSHLFGADVAFYSAGYPDGLHGIAAMLEFRTNVRRIVGDLVFVERERWESAAGTWVWFSSHGDRGQWVNRFQLLGDRILRIDAFEGR